jgi:hypothetical protein
MSIANPIPMKTVNHDRALGLLLSFKRRILPSLSLRSLFIVVIVVRFRQVKQQQQQQQQQVKLIRLLRAHKSIEAQTMREN